MTRPVGACGVVIDRSGRVLLVHRSDADEWELPGGAVEPGESPWDAAVREVGEETGLAVTVSSLLGVAYQPPHDHVVFDVGCRVVGGTARPDGVETDDLGWFGAGELPARLRPRHRQRVEPYLADPLGPTRLVVQPRPEP